MPSKRQSDPPPAATVWTRIIGAFTRTPATSVSKQRSTSPARSSDTSVDVPPMSNPTARSKPAAAATRAAPTTPPAGPESSAVGP